MHPATEIEKKSRVMGMVTGDKVRVEFTVEVPGHKPIICHVFVAEALLADAQQRTIALKEAFKIAALSVDEPALWVLDDA